MRIRLNSKAKPVWHKIATDGTQVLVVDDFLSNADELREYAEKLSYHVPVAGDYYLGLKAFATLDGAGDLVKWVGEQTLQRMFPEKRPPFLATNDLRPFCQFSVLAYNAKQLPNNYVEQHTDGTSWLATILHLSRHNNHRGTALWEHRPTGIHSWYRGDLVQNLQLEQFLGLRFREQIQRAFETTPAFTMEMLRAMIFRSNGDRKPFSLEENSDWRLLQYIPAKFNRLVAYPTWQIHSVIDTTNIQELSIDNMRLTMNNFVEYPFPKEVLPNSSTHNWNLYKKVDGLLG